MGVGVSIEAGSLYVVATPIGNLADITQRALEVLRGVDAIAAEDTRHSGALLRHFGIGARLVSLHEHNERQRTRRILELLAGGASVALISDAGTPLISDPGYHLVREARAAGHRVVPVPGASSVICALSAAGLPTDRFRFEGFLPARRAARRARLQGLAGETCTLVFLESSHRIVESLEDMAGVFGAEREAVVARELTKTFETIHGDRLEALVAWVARNPDQRKGEFVVMIHGRDVDGPGVPDAGAERVLRVLLEELPLKQAAKLAARISGAQKNALYELGLKLRRY